MRLKYSLQAIADMDSIAAFFELQNPTVLPKILSDIEAKLSLISDYPAIGNQQQDRTVRKAVTRRCRYIIHCRILRQAGEVQIVSIRHFKQARKFQNN